MRSLTFEDGFEALTYSCQHVDYPPSKGALLPAVVIDGSDVLGSIEPVKTNPDGNQVALLRVASSDGGFTVMATTAGPRGPRLRPGQLVLWRALSYSSLVTRTASDDRFGWLGLISSTLKPEWHDGRWIEEERFET
jgi:hypothetical protein